MNAAWRNVMLNSNTQKGFLKLPNDSMLKTIAVATSLCLVCSLLVSVAAVVLKPLQLENKLLDRKQNILRVAGIEDPAQSTDELFAQIETRVVDMQSV
jgi:Na+-transporting NADH:ubiquinone oxidoreductase subunit C